MGCEHKGRNLRLPVTTKIVTPLVLGADGKTLVGGTKDNKINVWEISP